ncbi:MAG: pirin-like C-terminal cupin domain-containing protein [Myxococcota bacterium]
MTAGRGIVHSERTPPALRPAGPHLHGLQLWVALPREDEDGEPSFAHHPAEEAPAIDAPGVSAALLAGTAYGLRSPVVVASPLVLVTATLQPGATFRLPSGHEQRAVYVLWGEITLGPHRVDTGTLAVLGPHADTVRAEAPTCLAVLGGASLGERYVWWNFVASTPERVEQAAADWRADRFPKVPGDEVERIPLEQTPRLR